MFPIYMKYYLILIHHRLGVSCMAHGKKPNDDQAEEGSLRAHDTFPVSTVWAREVALRGGPGG